MIPQPTAHSHLLQSYQGHGFSCLGWSDFAFHQGISQQGLFSAAGMSVLPLHMHTDRCKYPGSCCALQLTEVPTSLHKMINQVFRRWLNLAGCDVSMGRRKRCSSALHNF